MNTTLAKVQLLKASLPLPDKHQQVLRVIETPWAKGMLCRRAHVPGVPRPCRFFGRGIKSGGMRYGIQGG